MNLKSWQATRTENARKKFIESNGAELRELISYIQEIECYRTYNENARLLVTEIRSGVSFYDFDEMWLNYTMQHLPMRDS